MKKFIEIIKIYLIIILSFLNLALASIFVLFLLDRTEFLPTQIKNLPLPNWLIIYESKPEETQTPLVFNLAQKNSKTTPPSEFLPEIKIDPKALEAMLETRQNDFTSKAPLSEGKIIEIDLSSQRFLIWENGKLEGNWLTSTGIRGRDTQIGIFQVLDKLPMAYGVGPEGEFWAMPKWLGIYYAGSSENGIHALATVDGYQVGSGVLGYPSTNGCISLAHDVANKVYDWAEIGTLVMIHW